MAMANGWSRLETARSPTSRSGLVALIVANLFVALQTLRYDWGYYQAILIYWLEAVILGGYNVLRMMVVGVFGAARWAPGPPGGWIWATG
jgi:hypothetical protein